MPIKNPSRDLVMEEFQCIQNNVKNLLKQVKSKISFDVDGWSAPNFCAYYEVIAHFLDEEWFPISYALDLIASQGQHKGVHIARLFLECMKFYGLEHKIGGNTLDNVSSITTFIEDLVVYLPLKEFNLVLMIKIFALLPIFST